MTWELAAAFRGDRAAEARAVRVAFSRPPFAMRDARSRLQLVRFKFANTQPNPGRSSRRHDPLDTTN
jgi:hypothetical protein